MEKKKIAQCIEEAEDEEEASRHEQHFQEISGDIKGPHAETR